MTDKTKPKPLADKDLDAASGGLPAVQKVREAAARTTSSSLTKAGPGTLAAQSADSNLAD